MRSVNCRTYSMQHEHRRRVSWEEVRNLPHLWSPLKEDAVLAKTKWHSHACLPNSSQVFCVNAFRGLALLDACDGVLNQLFARAFSSTSLNAGKWNVEVEKEDRTLLGEGGRQQPTSVDAFCSTSSAVVCIESKFDRDGRDGFGGCSQAASRPKKCLGFFGPGSDAKTHTTAACRLQVAEGTRTARLYWKLAEHYFIPGVFALQTHGQECPFKGSSFQLMRNFLFAGNHARKHSLKEFYVLAICPRKHKRNLESQIQEFRKLLLPRLQNRIALATYEDYISTLRASGDEAQPLAQFLATRITDEIRD
jgi:hypothetical protein